MMARIRTAAFIAALPAAFIGTAAAQVPLAPAALQWDTLDGAAPFGNPIADNRTYIHGIFNQLEGATAPICAGMARRG